MSIRAMVWVFDHSQAEGSARLVMLALADNADDDGACWPSVPTIARKARVSERTVQRHIRDLVELGELVVAMSAGGHSNRYQLAMPNGDNLTPSRPSNGDTAVTAAVTLLSPRTVIEPKEPKNVSREDRAKAVEAWRRSEADKAWQAEHDIPGAFSYAQTELWKGWLTGPTPAAKRTVDFSRSWRNWVLRAWTDLTEYRRNDWRNTETAS